MTSRRVLQVGALTWAAVGLVVALEALGSPGATNGDSLALVAFASVGGPLAAALAAFALARRRSRTAGLLLLVSVATPTYFAWALNLPALLVGAVLVVAPTIMFPGERSLRRPSA